TPPAPGAPSGDRRRTADPPRPARSPTCTTGRRAGATGPDTRRWPRIRAAPKTSTPPSWRSTPAPSRCWRVRRGCGTRPAADADHPPPIPRRPRRGRAGVPLSTPGPTAAGRTEWRTAPDRASVRAAHPGKARRPDPRHNLRGESSPPERALVPERTTCSAEAEYLAAPGQPDRLVDVADDPVTPVDEQTRAFGAVVGVPARLPGRTVGSPVDGEVDPAGADPLGHLTAGAATAQGERRILRCVEVTEHVRQFGRVRGAET